jgi:hypothetical protein
MSPDRRLHIKGGSLKIEYPGSIGNIPFSPFVEFEISTEDEKTGGLRFARNGTVLGTMMYRADADGPNYIHISGDGPAKKDLLVNQTGRVGINMNGTEFQPVAQLHVRGSPDTDAIALHSEYFTDNSTIQFYSTSLGGGNADTKKVFLQLQDGDNLQLGTNAGNASGNIIFRMNGTDQNAIIPNGYTGIGTTDPEARLQVVNGQEAHPNPLNGNGYICVGEETGLNLAIDFDEILARNYNSPSTLHLQYDGGALSVGNNKMYMTAAGNVGLGTTNPFAKLDVRGRIRVEQNDEAIALDGNNPQISYWWNGNFRSWLGQYSTEFRMASNNRIKLESVEKIHLAGTQIAIGNVYNTADEYRVTVDGRIICEELKVKLHTNWPDYVFAEQYDLKPLSELKDFISQNKHLPNIPKASEVEKEGFEVGEMNRRLLEKVEELTLYVIQLQEQVDALKDCSSQSEVRRLKTED